MAHLYKRPRSPFWWIGYVENGRPVRKSTEIRHEGRKKPRPEGAETRILRKIEERLALTKFGVPVRPEDPTLEDWWSEYLAWYTQEAKPEPTTLYSIGYNTAPFRRWAKESAPHLGQVTASTLSKYFATRSVSDKTRKNEASFWAAVWDRAKALNLVAFESNPWREFIPRKIRTQNEQRPLTPTEVSLILEESEGWHSFACHVAYFTGERFGAILELKVADVDMERNVIQFTETKQSKRSKTPRIRFVFMLPGLKAFLQGFKPHGETWLDPDLIARNRSGRSVNHSMGDLFERLKKKYENKQLIDGKLVSVKKDKIPPAERLFAGVSFHSFRHTFATILDTAGIGQSTRMEILDHSTVGAHRRYVHEQAQKALSHAKELDRAFTLRAHTKI